MQNGVNFFGPSETADGIGRAAALNLRCLKGTSYGVNEFVLSRPVALQKKSHLSITDQLIKSLSYKINYFHFSARWVPHYFAQLSAGALDGFYNIGYWVCEVPKIPEQWAKQLRFFNEIWTASSFCQQAIARSASIPVIKIPHPIEEAKMTSRIIARQKGEGAEELVFLLIANVYSDAERKNILFTIRSFLTAFGKDPTVRLIVKVCNVEHDPLLQQKLAEISAAAENIEIIASYIPDDAIQALYEEADVFLSLHRAEGFGFSISDAISRGIPVITTGYSGNMDFCNARYVSLVDYELKYIDHERLRYKKEDVWAEINMDSAVEAFRDMKNNYNQWLTKTKLLRQRIQAEFSEVAISHLMEERLSLISRQFTFLNDLDGRTLDCEVNIKESYGF